MISVKTNVLKNLICANLAIFVSNLVIK